MKYSTLTAVALATILSVGAAFAEESEPSSDVGMSAEGAPAEPGTDTPAEPGTDTPAEPGTDTPAEPSEGAPEAEVQADVKDIESKMTEDKVTPEELTELYNNELSQEQKDTLDEALKGTEFESFEAFADGYNKATPEEKQAVRDALDKL